MPEFDWLEPLDRRIGETKRETEAIRKANEALKRLYDNNDEGMRQLARDGYPKELGDFVIS